MKICQICDKEISEAKYALIKGNIYKSCPGCSRNHGEHIFYKCPEDFGMTKKRITKNNPLGLQSHCSKCRAGRVGIHTNAIKCSELELENGSIINEVRLLPMSGKIFSKYDDVKKFLLEEMSNRGGTYYYMKSKMNCENNTFVLFQYDGKLIGYAICEKRVILDTPVQEDDFIYNGYYVFKKESIRVFKEPMMSEIFKQIDPDFKGFNQSNQKKGVGLLPAIFQYVTNESGTIEPKHNESILPEEIDENEEKHLKEGQKKIIVVNAYERNSEARARCLKYYKKLNGGHIKCEICGFNFGKFYGKEFEGKIHIHHLKEIASIGEEYEINAEKDLIPICPNCHMVVHSRKPAITIDEMRELLKNSLKEQ